MNDKPRPATGIDPHRLMQRLRQYRDIDEARGRRQVCLAVILYVGSWVGMAAGWHFSLALFLLCLPLATAFFIQIFVLMHDCGHRALFRSSRCNELVGLALAAIVFTPFHYWRRSHAYHHSSNAMLDRQGHGYLPLLTTREFSALGAWKRVLYRFYRHPVVFLVILPFLYFLVIQRLPFHVPRVWRAERSRIFLSDLVLLGFYGPLAALVGWQTLAAVQLPILLVASSIIAWFFLVQHTFTNAYWARAARWTFIEAALEGSSLVVLPPVLHWITANVGFHHVHHLDCQIPNYHLARCHAEIPEIQGVPSIHLTDALKLARLGLYDEESKRVVSFEQAARLEAERAIVPLHNLLRAQDQLLNDSRPEMKGGDHADP